MDVPFSCSCVIISGTKEKNGDEMKVILAEKPSVAKNIADALKIKNKRDGYYEGNGYIITWAFGHLLQLFDAKDYDSKMSKWKMDNFPFIPDEFKYKVKQKPGTRNAADQGAKKQLKIIKQVVNRPDVERIISACDYDREGQVIGDTILQQVKPQKPVYRLLINEWTPAEVIAGIERVRDNAELKPLQDAGISRQWADWVIGINLTSVATLKYQKGSGKALNIGRVLLPTLKIIYDRDKEIEAFKPEDYFKLNATFQAENKQTYQGVYTVGKEDKFSKIEDLKSIQQLIEGKHAEIIEKKVEKKKEFAPFLFNLSNLQGFITNKYRGWTSDKVLKVAQSLYEKKLITYPRTSSIALDESLVGKAAKVLKTLAEDVAYKDELVFKKTKRVFNNAKVESHSAIIPTYLKPKKLTSDQQLVYTAIKNRFLMQFMPVAEFEETILTTKADNKKVEGVFMTRGRVQLIEGWKKVESIQSKETLLPLVKKGEYVQVVKSDVSSHVTKPPERHSEKTLLRVMETCGKKVKEEDTEEEIMTLLAGYSIGTPATRAETIKKLKDVGYVSAEHKYLTCTDLGKKLVETFPVKELFNLEFTGRLEKELYDIEKQAASKDVFLSRIFSFTEKAVTQIKEEREIVLQTVAKEKISTEPLGKCPACGSAVIEGRKGFGCSNWKSGCKFVVWKNDKFLATMRKKPTKTLVKSLLKNDKVFVKGLTSKNGKKFNAYLQYKKNPNKEYYSWDMSFEK